MSNLKTIPGCGAALLLLTVRASGGEPLLTDDPGTPGRNAWELNVGFSVADFQNSTAWEVPLASLSYGLGERFEVGVSIPFLVVDNQGEEPKGSLGDAGVGVQWRFLDEEANGISVSTAPAVTFNTVQRSIDLGIVDRGTIFTLPVEVGKTIGPVDMYAEVGRDFFNSGKDLWFSGVAAEWGFTERWTLVGELYGNATYDFDDREVVINGGLQFALRENLFLSGAAGIPLLRADTNPNQYITYLGVQWTF